MGRHVAPPPPDEHRNANDNAAAKAIFDLFQDWLKRIESKIDTMTGRLEGKADRAEVTALAARIDNKVDKTEFERLAAKLDTESTRIDGVDKRVGENAQRASDQTTYRRWVIPLISNFVYVGATVVLVIYTLNTHH